jgi:predicted 3-demethylubiquinone-9 3-methyltransferase (glyoxalase superfamily)
VVDIARYTAANPRQEGSVMLVTFELAGQRFYALNGGQNEPFNESVSLLVECETQEEVDTLWSQLTDGGTEAPCGWLKDRYGLAWQITPRRLLARAGRGGRGGWRTPRQVRYRTISFAPGLLRLSEAFSNPHPFGRPPTH